MQDGVYIEGVTKCFGKTVAVDDVTLSIRSGEFVSLLGPSGCGKTTLLRLIAGFESPDSGKIFFEGKDITSLSPQKRPSAMVFQNYALFPNMTIEQNVAYGLRVRKFNRGEIKTRVAEVLDQVELQGLAKRSVTELSGGQQQRVALARAIAVQPDVILFDEPLSNLDVALREKTRNELRVLQSKIGMTSIYVTHDQEEAMSLSDWIAVMRDGKIVQTGKPEHLYKHPDTAFVASFLGGANIIDNIRFIELVTKGSQWPPGKVLAVRAEDIDVLETGPIEVKVTTSYYHGPYREVWLEWENIRLKAHVAPGQVLTDTVRIDVQNWTWVNA